MAAAKTPKPKAKKKKPQRAVAPPLVGRLGAEQWLAVRLKSGAGPMEPKVRRRTRAERAREAFDREADARDGKDAP